MKRVSIFAIFIVSIMALFGGVFGLYTGLTYGVIEGYISSYTVFDTHNEQNQVDSSLRSSLYEISLFHNSVLFNTINIQSLNSSGASQAVFNEIYQEGAPNSNLLYGAVLVYQDTVSYSDSGLTGYLSETEISKGKAAEKHYTYIGADQFPDGGYFHIFAIPVLESRYNAPALRNGTCFYFLNLEYVYQFLANIGTGQGNSIIVSNLDNSSVETVFDHERSQIGIRSVRQFDYLHKNYGRAPDPQGIDSFYIYQSLENVNYSYDLGWSIITYMSADYIYSSFSSVYITVTVVGVVSMALLLLAAIFLLRRSLKPIGQLASKVKLLDYNSLEKNQEAKVVPVRNEIAQLEDTYDEMVERTRALRLQLIDDLEAQRRLELDSLQIQINPHFLYNVLDSIAWVAKIEKQKEIEDIVIELARFYRLSLHKGERFISVSEEIEIIEHFFKIELFRYRDKFTYSLQVSDDVKEKKTLKLILQPLVENAIKHGMLTLKKKGKIEIKAGLENGFIVYEINDNGVGFDREGQSEDAASMGGYGIHNIKERLRLQYGDQYDFIIESVVNKGTRVQIKIPAID